MDSTDNIETSAKSNRPETRNAHTEMEAKKEKSIGSLRSFRMNKPKKNITNLNQNISDELTAYPGRDHDHKSQPPAEKSKDIGVSAKDIRQKIPSRSWVQNRASRFWSTAEGPLEELC
jgi:hypothetical protein